MLSSNAIIECYQNAIGMPPSMATIDGTGCVHAFGRLTTCPATNTLSEPQVIERIFPTGKPLIDFRVDIAKVSHGLQLQPCGESLLQL